MKIQTCLCNLICFISIFLTGIEIHADGERISVTDLPKLVVSSVKENKPNGKIVEAFKVIENGHLAYEIDVEDGDDTYMFTVDTKGKVLVIYKLLSSPDDLPKLVLKSIKDDNPKAIAKEAALVTEGIDVYYEIEAIHEDGDITYIVSTNGVIQEKQTVLDIRRLQKPVLKTIESKYPMSKILDASSVVETGRSEIISVIIETKNGKVLDIQLDRFGKFISSEEIK